MLPTITDTAAPRKSRHAPKSLRSDAALSVDDVIFAPDRWFALDANNRRVAGVVVPTLEAGLGLVGRGRVASIVGTLRVKRGLSTLTSPGVRGTKPRPRSRVGVHSKACGI